MYRRMFFNTPEKLKITDKNLKMNGSTHIRSLKKMIRIRLKNLINGSILLISIGILYYRSLNRVEIL